MDQVGEHEILCVLIEAVFTFLQVNLASTGSQLSLQLSYIHFSSINVVKKKKKNIYISKQPTKTGELSTSQLSHLSPS